MQLRVLRFVKSVSICSKIKDAEQLRDAPVLHMQKAGFLVTLIIFKSVKENFILKMQDER